MGTGRVTWGLGEVTRGSWGGGTAGGPGHLPWVGGGRKFCVGGRKFWVGGRKFCVGGRKFWVEARKRSGSSGGKGKSPEEGVQSQDGDTGDRGRGAW